MIFVDVSHTAHSPARSGVQRVVRSLVRHLPGAHPVTHDPYARCWRALSTRETVHLNAPQTGTTGSRSARWPLPTRLRGLLSRARLSPYPTLEYADAALVPEIFSPAVAASLPALRESVRGPLAAVFHDAIALRLPELTPAGTVARFPAYLRDLASFDGVAAVSEDSRRSLIDFWRWAGLRNPPPVVALPLGIDAPPSPAGPLPTGEATVLCVGTLEGRKNHVALLDACEQLWSSGLHFRLTLIGHANKQTGAPALARLAALRHRPITYLGSVDDTTLEAAYRDCLFTVYPSLMEGFGLPVLESLARGRPCIVGRGGALAESASQGGCLVVDAPTPAALAPALRSLLENRPRCEQLASEAVNRPLKPWSTYAADIASWLTSLRITPR
ncbi:glycosyltransferase [Nibricoccus sp. IMCC34717]|uniref:glycosyltransferase n=1 Tax=Nibricoccus sp. IMCC34717 TaxID=3034021 RepID=UPI00384F8A24